MDASRRCTTDLLLLLLSLGIRIFDKTMVQRVLVLFHSMLKVGIHPDIYFAFAFPHTGSNTYISQ